MTDARVVDGWSDMDRSAVSYTPEFNPIPAHRAAYPGSSDIYGSLHDMIRFALFHLRNPLPDQKKILSVESIKKMQEAYPPANNQYGGGWYFDINELGYRSVYHGGDGPGSDNFMRLIPAEKMALVILCNSEYSGLGELQEEICTALIPEFARISRSESPSEVVERKIPGGFFGSWKGKIVAYDREIEVELKMTESGGATILLSEQTVGKLDLVIITENFLLGYFPGVVPTPDALRYPGRTRLALIRQGNQMYGQATVDQFVKDWQFKYELSSWVELRKK
jgi:hypothetical protein